MHKRLLVLLLIVLVWVPAWGIASAQSNQPAITAFTSSVSTINRADLANRRALVPVSWAASNRPTTANLVFEQILPDGRVMNVELPRTNPIVPSSGNGVVQPFPPGEGAANIRLQIRMVDTTSGRALAARELIIPIGDATTVTPRIVSFSTSATNVSRVALANRTARIPVSWVVENRPNNSNLVFEQVLDNNTITNVELPRQNPIVPSSGNGVTAPFAPSSTATKTITLRLRLVDLNASTTLAQSEITLPVLDEQQPVPTIRTFSTTATGVDRAALNAGTVRLPVTFAVDNRPPNSNLLFEQVLEDNSVVNVELPRSNPIVPSSGNGVVAPKPPRNAATTSITLALRLVDLSTQATLVRQTLTVPITAPAAPAIRTFSTTATSVSRPALVARTARLPVSFAVDNRPPNSNLVFEQVLEDSSVVNVELPRSNPIVPSSGNGVVSPFPPQRTGTTTITLRLRVIDLTSQNTLVQQTITLPVSEPGTLAITSFTTTATSVDRAALTARTARIPVAWAVDNRPPNSNLIFEQVLDTNNAVNVELPRQNPIVPSSGSGVVAPFAPISATTPSITLRLRVVDLATQATLAQQTITVLINDTASGPVIRSFSTVNTTGVDINLLNNRTARIPVTWAVDNRPANSNLVFEQVLEDSTVVNVELPRQVPIVPSSGNGVVAPVPPKNAQATQITLRLRLINLANNTTITQAEVKVPILGLPSTPPTPTTPPTSSQPVQITTFTVTPNPVARGGQVTLTWNVTGGVTRVRIERLTEYGAVSAETILDQQPATGTAPFTLPADYIQTASFQISAYNAAGQETIQTATVNITCPFRNTLDTPCPITQAEGVATAFQPLERGLMIWRGDTRKIYVMYNDGTWQEFNDTWVEGQTTGGDSAPSGLFKPERGFGKVWFEIGGVGVLGWATAGETAYTAKWETYQVLDGSKVTVGPQFTLPDGRVARLGRGWRIG